MHDELIRAVVAAPVVVALPAALATRLATRMRRAVFCAALMIAAHAVARISDTRSVVIVIAGLLAVVFLGGALIGQLLHPFALRLGGDSVSGIENAGRMIGWLERTLLYGLVLAGAPDAAAIVIAAKSVARFPSFAEERFAEYYLIGTLLSFLTAAAVGVAVRAALGLHPLLSSSP